MEVVLWLVIVLSSLFILFALLACTALLVYGAAHLIVLLATRLLTKITSAGRHSRN